MGFRIQISGDGCVPICTYPVPLCFVYMSAEDPPCFPLGLEGAYAAGTICWDPKDSQRVHSLFWGALLHLLFSVLLHTLKTRINIQSSLKGWNTDCTSSSPSPNVCAFSGLKSHPVSRESPLLCPGLSPCLWVRWTPTVVV